MGLIKKFIDYLTDNPEGYWFKRKLYGWGWTPATREGWLVTIVILLLIIGNVLRVEKQALTDSQAVLQVIVPTFVLVGILILISYLKGEKPKWQWGFPKDEHNDTTPLDR